MMRYACFCKKVSAVLLLLVLFACAACAEVTSRNPLLTPPVIEEYTETEDNFLNILLLGIDYGGELFKSSGGKKHQLEECHTDGVMVVSLNRTKDTIDLVSIPRDSLTYVPGIRGIYKLNGAINCGETVEEGCEIACRAASWHLGGIEIEKYVAVDATALAALGDAIGGIEFTMDTGFQGIDRWYEKGETYHLDGVGIMDYMRARKSATNDYNDLGRTKRQRQMMSAIFSKLKKNPELIKDVLKVYQSGELNIFTNVGIIEAMTLIPDVLKLDFDALSTSVLSGPYKTFMKNFTFNDQEIRRQVIRDVYGLEVPQMEYVSYEYTQWLTDAGLTTAKYINMGRAVLEHAKGVEGAVDSGEYAALDAAVDACIQAFDAAADSMNDADTNRMIAARNELKPAVEKAARAFRYPEEIKWGRNTYWYREPMINECQLNWN